MPKAYLSKFPSDSIHSSKRSSFVSSDDLVVYKMEKGMEIEKKGLEIGKKDGNRNNANELQRV